MTKPGQMLRLFCFFTLPLVGRLKRACKTPLRSSRASAARPGTHSHCAIRIAGTGVMGPRRSLSSGRALRGPVGGDDEDQFNFQTARYQTANALLALFFRRRGSRRIPFPLRTCRGNGAPRSAQSVHLAVHGPSLRSEKACAPRRSIAVSLRRRAALLAADPAFRLGSAHHQRAPRGRS